MSNNASYNIHAEPVGHGNSPAAWTAVLIMIVGSIISSVAFCMESAMGFWAGVVVMLLGLAAGYAMKKAGYGVNGSKVRSSHGH